MPAAKVSNGKHPYNALSPAFVRNVTEPGSYGDGGCLYLLVDDNGSKRWVLRLTIAGKRHDMGLGSLRLVSLKAARDQAVKWRRIARDGQDPLSVRRQERQVHDVPTFEAAARQVHQEHAKTFRNEKHAEQWLWSLDKYVFGQIGNRPIDQITSADILQILTPHWHRIPETARRVKQRMKVVFDWAKASGFRVGDNPTEGISKVLPKHNTEAGTPCGVALQRIARLHSKAARLRRCFGAARLRISNPDRGEDERSDPCQMDRGRFREQGVDSAGRSNESEGRASRSVVAKVHRNPQ
jgi:Phage integrase central domain/Arm DNA-binding domain